MRSSSFSSHIPDLDLITFYAERRVSWLSRISPWTKLGMLILLVAVTTLSRNLLLLFLLWIAVISLYATAGLPIRKLFLWYTLPAIFVFSLIGILVWSEPGTPVLSFEISGWDLVLTDNGILLAVTLLLKAVTVVSFSLLFLMTTRYQHLAGMISRIFPSPLDQIFLMTYRFLFLTLAMTASLLRSVRARGGGLIHSIRMQGKLFAGIFALVFIRSFEQGERVHKAMTARGFSGSYSTGESVPRPCLPEYGFLACAGAGVIVLAVTTAGGV